MATILALNYVESFDGIQQGGKLVINVSVKAGDIDVVNYRV
jgi:hypothetical protein